MNKHIIIAAAVSAIAVILLIRYTSVLDGVANLQK